MLRKITYILFVFLVGCTSGDRNNRQSTILIEDGKNYFGKKINDHKSVGLKEFDVLANNTDTLFVKLKAGISEVCQEDGCWFRINLHNGKRMIVLFDKDVYGIPKDVAGKHVMIEGKSYLQTRSEDEMKRFAKQAGELQWIIDTIKGTHIQRTFIAIGTVITE